MVEASANVLKECRNSYKHSEEHKHKNSYHKEDQEMVYTKVKISGDPLYSIYAPQIILYNTQNLAGCITVLKLSFLLDVLSLPSDFSGKPVKRTFYIKAKKKIMPNQNNLVNFIKHFKILKNI